MCPVWIYSWLFSPPPTPFWVWGMDFGGILVLFHFSMLKKEGTVSHWCIVHTLHFITPQNNDGVESSVYNCHSLISTPSPTFHCANFIKLLNYFKSISDPFRLQVITNGSSTTKSCFHYISVPCIKIYRGFCYFRFCYYYFFSNCSFLSTKTSLSL